MDKSVVGLYDDLSDARDVVDDLIDAGIPRDNISLVARDVGEEYATYLGDEEVEMDYDEGDTVAEGAVGGAVLGGLAGVLLGLGAFAIPGIGPVIGAGPLAAGLAGAGIGAAAGGLIGALVEWGIPEEEAEYYAEGIRRGGTLVAARVPELQVEDVIDVMDQHDPVDIEERVTMWQESGWTGYDREADPWTAERITAERRRYGMYDDDYS